jgi:uncharacterized membrane protein
MISFQGYMSITRSDHRMNNKSKKWHVSLWKEKNMRNERINIFENIFLALCTFFPCFLYMWNFLLLLFILLVITSDIGLARKFLRFFKKFLRTVEKVLEVSILRLYKGRTNIFRTTTKLWIWMLILN